MVITGGEPLRQPIELLCELLLQAGYKPQIETNGTIYRDLPKGTEIICSPKTTKPKYTRLREDILPNIAGLKFIVGGSGNYANINDIGQADYNIPVYLQPMDELDNKLTASNYNRAIKLALKHKAKLSIQTHKFLDIE